MNDSIEYLNKKATEYRKTIIDMIYKANTGHPGGSLSVIDILTVLFNKEINFSEKERDKIILSKGHTVPALYGVFYDLGFIEERELNTFRKINSRLQGHPDRNKISYLDANTGLLGQGLSIGVGMALAKKLKKSKNRVYVIIGDGEMHEGQIWEALMSASHYNLENLTVILDYNKLSSKDDVNKVMNLEPVLDKIKAFNLEVKEIDGHNIKEILEAIEWAKKVNNKPTFIIANTVKGKGVSYMENNPKWHSSGLSEDEYKTALSDINKLGGER